jgi:hypothetical protein
MSCFHGCSYTFHPRFSWTSSFSSFPWYLVLCTYNICSSHEFPANKLRWNINTFCSGITYPLNSSAVIAYTFYYREQASLTDIVTHKVFVLLWCVVWCGSLLQAFRDSLSAPFPMTKQSNAAVRSQKSEVIEYSAAKVRKPRTNMHCKL